MHDYDSLREVFDVLMACEKTEEGYLLTAVGRLFNHRGIGPTLAQRDVKERIRELAEIGIIATYDFTLNSNNYYNKSNTMLLIKIVDPDFTPQKYHDHSVPVVTHEARRIELT